MNDALQREALRQQALLRALCRDASPAAVAGWLRDGERFDRGLLAYRANGGALAERALAAAFPTLVQLLGDESFAALSRAFWHGQPPLRGDVAEWGAALPAFIAAAEQLAGEPYLADVARLEWAVHGAEHAADGAVVQGLERLADGEPAALQLQLQPGSAVISSPHPIVTLWQAHRSQAEDRFAPVRAAFAAARGEHALVWRAGWKVEVRALDSASALFTAAVLAGGDLESALSAGGSTFEFEPWLLAALQCGWLAAVIAVPAKDPS